MASTRVSSLLNRFKFEQKAKKKLNASGSSYNVLETSSICENSSSVSVNAKHSEMNGDSTLSRSTTPDSDGKSNHDHCLSLLIKIVIESTLAVFNMQ